jgi:hypothetical protein
MKAAISGFTSLAREAANFALSYKRNPSTGGRIVGTGAPELDCFCTLLYEYPAFEAFEDFSDFVESIIVEPSNLTGSNPCRGATNLAGNTSAPEFTACLPKSAHFPALTPNPCVSVRPSLGWTRQPGTR